MTGATPGATYVISVKYTVKSLIGGVYSGADRKSTYTFASYLNGSAVAANNTSGTIDALAGCQDNTPLPGDCTLPGSTPVITAKDTNMNVTVYPNPFTNNFKLNVENGSDEDVQIRVYDMLGKLMETSTVKTSDIEAFEIGNRYPTGVYNVIVTQGTETKTQRVIKR